MDVGWIDDLLALEEHGTLIGAAAARHVTQPAFSRRIAAIEAWCGASLVDRSRRPLRLRPEARALLPNLRAAAASFNQLREDLRRAQSQSSKVVIATQHSLAISLIPGLYADLEASNAGGLLRLRSVNRTEGLVLLLTGAADVLICHETASHPLALGAVDVERCRVEDDRLVPVTGDHALARKVEEALKRDQPIQVPVVTYPADAFLGRVLRDECLPHLSSALQIDTRVETALTPAVAGFVQGRALVCWLPETMIASGVRDGALHRLPDRLGVARLSVNAVRIRSHSHAATARFWGILEKRSRCDCNG